MNQSVKTRLYSAICRERIRDVSVFPIITEKSCEIMFIKLFGPKQNQLIVMMITTWMLKLYLQV